MATPPPGTTPARQSHALDEAALARHLDASMPGFRGPMTIWQFEGGQSNPTYLIVTASGEYVLRKKPPGRLLPSAHQVEREYRVMAALAGTGVPVPACRLLCEDASIVGTPFFVMDRVPGRIFWDPGLPALDSCERRALYDDMIAVLARLHAVPPEAAGLADFGRAGGYFARQVARWSQQYDASRTDEVPAMTSLMSWLPAHLPANEDMAIVHGDFRIDNLIVHPTDPRIVAVIDWELSTLGHPLADVAYAALAHYITPRGERRLGDLRLTAAGIPTVDEWIDRYAALTGRDARSDWPFLVAFSLFRLASIAQGVYARGLQGNASSTAALRYRDAAQSLAGLAWEMVSGTS